MKSIRNAHAIVVRTPGRRARIFRSLDNARAAIAYKGKIRPGAWLTICDDNGIVVVAAA